MPPDSVRGRLDGLVLSVLEDAPRHGYAVIEALRQRSGGAFDLPTGTIYPALRRLERAGYVRSQWTTVAGRRRRTYQLTPGGTRLLAEERSAWRDFAAAVEGVLRPA